MTTGTHYFPLDIDDELDAIMSDDDMNPDEEFTPKTKLSDIIKEVTPDELTAWRTMLDEDKS